MKKLLFVALVSSFIVSCKKDKADDNQSQFPFYFTATINGSAIKYEANDLTSQFECGTSAPFSVLGDDYDIYEGTFIQDGNDPSKNNIYVHVLKFFDHDPSSAERLAMFKTGSYPYGFGSTSSSTIDGVSINYADAAGKEWFSESVSQAGSTFSISEVVDNPDNTSFKIFTATFSCKLYDGSGGSMDVSNAVIRGKIYN
ncbi:MAG: hypothetical protein ABI675_05210 [Chitinophagaceae bacterium]